MDTNDSTTKEQTKMVGGYVPVELYWKFKAAHNQRKEKAGEALEHALRLYCDIEEAPKHE